MNLSINGKSLLQRGSRAVRRDGFWKTLRAVCTDYVFVKRQYDEFDHHYGTDTSEVVPLWKLRISSPNERFGWRYETSDPHELKLCLKHIPVRPEALVFIDLGCGKGRMLIVARDLGFRKIVGIEFAPELVKVSKANLAKAGVAEAQVLHMDASDFSFPSENFLLYLFNPFSKEVMKRVIWRLESTPTSGFVVYNNARCADLFDSSRTARRVATVQGTRFPTTIWSIRQPTTPLNCV